MDRGLVEGFVPDDDIKDGQKLEEDRKVYAELTKVMTDYDARFQSELSDEAVAKWQKKRKKK